MPTLEANKVRLALDKSSKLRLLDAADSSRVEIPQGAGVDIECAVFDGPTSEDNLITDFDDVTSIQLIIRAVSPNGAVLLEQSVDIDDVVPDIFFSDWLEEQGQQFTFSFSALETSITLPTSSKLPIYFVVRATTPDDEFNLGFGYGEIVDIGIVSLADEVDAPFTQLYINTNGNVQNAGPVNYAVGQLQVGGVALISNALANGKIYVGNASNFATGVTPTGDVTITNAGVTVIGATRVTSSMLNSNVFSTAHSWSGVQTFTTPVLGAATGTSVVVSGNNGFKVTNTVQIGDPPGVGYPGIWFGTNTASPTYLNYAFLYDSAPTTGGTILNAPAGQNILLRIDNILVAQFHAAGLEVVGVITNGGTQVLSTRNTGWAAMTGITNKATVYDTATVTLPQLAGRVMALQAALTTHGLLGT